MKKLILILLSLFLITINVISQTKTILGDTAFWYNRCTKPLFEDIGSKDFLESEDDFNFRMQYYGQIIEIWKSRDKISGTLTNYTFKLGKKEKTIFSKTILKDSLAIQSYELINNSGILGLKSDRQIDGWQHGFDGITYIIEHSDKNTYWYKSYWTPSAQDSLKEAVIVNNFISNISNILDLRNSSTKFRDKLPRNGCYTNGGITQTCYISNSYEIGYSGSIKNPLGYMANINVGYIGNLATNFGLSVIHQFDTNGNYDFSFSIIKGSLFIRKKKGINDYLLYSYRQRKHEEIKSGIKYQNHNVLYGLNLKSTSVAVGIDFLKGENSKIGGSILINQYLSKPRFSLIGEASIFEDQFDYRIGISRFFNLNIQPLRGIYVGVYYENFAKYGNLGWSLSTTL